VNILNWRHIEWKDIPSREEFEELTLNFLRSGITNSDRMRDEIRKARNLILKRVTGDWNSTPRNKFVNEHAWALENLVVNRTIENISDKEYRLVHP
jgi:hypothetical protein